jgi:hypothetical protein
MLKNFRWWIIVEHIQEYKHAKFGEDIRGLRGKKIFFS